MNSNMETFVPFDYKWRGIQRLAQAATPAHDTKFLVGLGRAFYWQSLLDTGAMASGSAIARAEGLITDQFLVRVARRFQREVVKNRRLVTEEIPVNPAELVMHVMMGREQPAQNRRMATNLILRLYVDAFAIAARLLSEGRAPAVYVGQSDLREDLMIQRRSLHNRFEFG